MTEQRLMDKPELETLDYKPAKSSRATGEEITPVIEPETKDKNSEVVGQHFEQPNQNIILVKTIQGLMTCVCNGLYKLDRSILESPNYQYPHKLIGRALREMDSFEQTTLELQKAFE